MRKEEFFKDAVPNSNGPLEGIRVMEATTAVAGPLVGTLLADLGAENIKIEQPGTGDMCRRTGPFVESSSPLDSSSLFLSVNRNKKNITLNLKSPKGQELFKELARRMDILVENFKPGTLSGWGLGYEEIKQVKPDIIYTSVSGYGQFGPRSPKPSYDAVGQAMGGLMGVTGYEDGPPLRAGFGLGDDLAGWQGAFGSIAALVYRMKTGKGQHVDISQQDTILYCSDWGVMSAANANYQWKRMGSRVPGASPYNTYRCKDDYVFIAITLDSHWARFCKIIGREELIDDPRTHSRPTRAENWQLVEEVVNGWVKERTAAEVVDTLDEAQLVCVPIMSFQQLIRDEHVLQRDMVVEVEHPLAGPLKLYGVGPKFSVSPGRVRMPAPMLGQHNEEVYGGLLGLGSKEMTALREEGVV
ncbi:MAG: CoA transferase [Nitrospinae bacterium]|nr:CoA transferase [Nitrospinota bacterium]